MKNVTRGDTVYIEFISRKLIWKRNGRDGNFYVVGFGFSESETGYATFCINEEQICNVSYHRNHKLNKQFAHIKLGDENTYKNVSIVLNGKYTNIKMKNSDIATVFMNNKNEWKKKHLMGSDAQEFNQSNTIVRMPSKNENIIDINDFKEIEHTAHNSPELPYSVRGHYRHYKNGKVIYIKPHMRNLKAMVNA